MIKILIVLLMAMNVQANQTLSNFDAQLAWQPKQDMKQAFDADFMVMMATMFPKSDLAIRNVGTGFQTSRDRQDFVKRLYLLLLLNPPKFRPENQDLTTARYDTDTQSVTYMMRGRRWLIDFTGIAAEDIVKILSGSKNIVQKRTAASHGARINKDGYVIETKLSGLKSAHAVIYGILGRHLGVNIPLGGYGNPAINNSYLIGADGTPVDQNGNTIKSKTQHGHVYIYAQTFGKHPVPGQGKTDTRSTLLIGIEPSAPGYKSMFNVAHDIASASKDSSRDPSLTNSPKWRPSGIRFYPADYNGLLTSMDVNAVLQWENACKKYLSLPMDVQEKFMAKWLRVPAQDLIRRHEEVMRDIFDASHQMTQPSVWQQPTLPHRNQVNQGSQWQQGQIPTN